MKIGIITAMSREHAQICHLLQQRTQRHIAPFDYTEGVIGRNSIILMQCGIGKVNSAVGTSEMIRSYSPDVIISSGVAGGIDQSLAVMDVVVSSRIVYHDVWCGEGNDYGQVQGLPTYYDGNNTLLNCATSLQSKFKIHSGLICSGDKFITDREELNTIKSNFPDGLAVDMESAAIAQVCHLYNTSFVSFRIISDTPGTENHQEQYEDFWGTIADKSFSTMEALLAALPTTI